jgi:RNA 2',3'-cyclic 3'-phosphodiesterase
MRLFVAIDLTDAQRTAASRVVESLQRALEGARAPRAVRWAPPAQMHVTLRFIGEVTETDGARLAESLAPPLAVPPFTLACGRAGMFPGPARPRVLWIGLAEGAAGAAASHDAIEQRVTAAGVAPEARAFHAHVTIGRVRELRSKQAAVLRDAMTSLKIDLAAATVTHTTLYRSHLSPKGARYEPLVRTMLTG